MCHIRKIIFISIAILLLGVRAYSATVDSLSYGVFGNVTIYTPDKTPESVVLFVSGDGGWNEGVIDMAKYLVKQNALVVGINILHYFKNIQSLKTACYYPAGDFEELSMLIQKKYQLSQYFKPVLVGYSSGATLIYGMLVQAPANTFKGAISLGFCPDIEIDKPLCKGSGLESHVLKEGKSFYLESTKKLSAPFIVLEGMVDQVCSYPETKKFMENMPNAEIITLPKVGHGFSVVKNWLPQYLAAYQKVLDDSGYVEKVKGKYEMATPNKIPLFESNMPLTFIPASGNENLPLAFFISGDGGWSGFDQSVCENLSEKGMPVIGLDAQKYFWKEKQPQETSDDVASAVDYYLKQLNKNSVVIIGYSFGACVAPFIANNFPLPLRDCIKGVYCFSPDLTGDFEIHVADMIHFKTKDKYNVNEEMEKIKSLNPVCIFGIEEDKELRNCFSESGIKVETLPGNHHYENNFKAIAEIICKDF
jgi:type IV secretory pathway VirJ component